MSELELVFFFLLGPAFMPGYAATTPSFFPPDAEGGRGRGEFRGLTNPA
jgi:hypothetical protein